MNYHKTTSTVVAALLLSLNCATSAPAFAGDDLSSFFENAGGSLADMVKGMRAESAKVDEKNPEAQPIQPQTGNNELLHFWEDLKADTLDDICKGVELPLDQGFDVDQVGGIEGNFKRYMKQYPDNKIAVIDEVGVKLKAGHTFTDIFNVNGNTFNIGFSGGLEGKSVVVRKTEETKYCKNLLTILDLRKVKTILPINEKRISEMKVNEIWKFPARIYMGVSGGLGYPVTPWLNLGFSLGTSKELKPSVTLFRMDEKHLRMRIRLDRITVQSAGVSAGTSFDAGMIGLPEAEEYFVAALGKQVNRTLVKEFNKYIALRMGLSTSRAKGKKILLEFVIDPTNPEQVEKLVDFLKGDLGIIKKLIEMGVRFNDFSSAADNAEGQAAMQNVDEVAQQALGLNSTFAGANHFNGTSHAMNVVLPVVMDRESSSGQRYDRYQTSGSDQVLHVQNVSRNVSVSNINVPFVGKVFKHNTNQNFYVANYEGKDGKVGDAAMVYQRYEGYIKHDETNARGMIREMNEILKYAGTQGNGINSEFTIDENALFPHLAGEEANPTGQDSEGNPIPDTRRYKSAIMSFTMVFTQEAVRSIVAAPPAVIMKAVLNVMDGIEKEIVSTVQHLFKIDAAGKIDYDWKAARKLLAKYERDNGDDKFDPLTAVNNFCRNVSQVISDISGLGRISDQKARSERLAAIMGGKGKSGVGYENMLQVMVQLVSTKDIFASLNIQTDKRIKDEANIASNYNVYNTNLQAGYNNQLNAANAMRDRFADPSVLSD
jgi:hypothetical protein